MPPVSGTTGTGRQAWMRQIDVDVTTEMEDAIIETIDELDGRTFPATTGAGHRLGQGSGPPANRNSSSCSAPRSWRSPTNGWGCSAANDHRTGTTPASSGAATDLELNGATLGPEIAVTDIPPFELDT